MTSENCISSDEIYTLTRNESPSAEDYRRQLEAVCNNATLALFIMDECQQCVYMNPAAEKLTGFSLSEVRGRALHDIIHHTRPDGSPYPLDECPIDQAFPLDNQEQGEEIFVHKNGTFYPVSYTASPIREGSGIVGTIIEIRDITQEKRDQQARQELDRAKAAFFSNVSHEFRTPLTLMLGPAEDALADAEEPLSPRQRQRIEAVYRNGQRLLKLVNTLLEFSRVEENRVQAVYEPTDLAQFTLELASLFRATMERASLTLVVDCPPLPEPIYVDRDMWEKVMLNLLSNAFKFTLEGEVAVTLRSQAEHVELEVRDTGIGIPENELSHIFERFHRVQGSAGRTYEGSGIGLALVQDLVHLHGGTIQVQSEVGQGTSFVVSIPKGHAHLPYNRIGAPHPLALTGTVAASYVEEALRWLPEPDAGTGDGTDDGTGDGDGNGDEALSATQAASAPPHSMARILIVDDNADMRGYLKRLLSQQYDVEVVGDGIAALAAIQRQLPDLVLTDVMMPRLDGFDLLRSLRSVSPTNELPIILLSARAGEEARVEGLAAGADDYLVKPFSAPELLARVESMLKMAQVRREAAEALREREQFFRDLTNTAPVLLWTALPDGTIDFVSQSWTDYCGIDPDVVCQGEWLNSIHPDDRDGAIAAWANSLQTGQIYEGLYRIRCAADQGYRWFVGRAVLTQDAEGVPVRWFGSLTDIEAQKQAEVEREQLLAREQAAREQAEVANRVKDEFLAVLSHELRSPLNPILGWSRLLQTRTFDAEKTKEALQIIERNAKLQADLIEDLLDVSRILRGKLSLNVYPVNLVTTVDAALETVRLAAEAKSIQMKTWLEPEVGQVSGDPARLQQVVWNLLSNAVKFTPEGGQVEITLVRFNFHAQLTISDTGKGIVPEFLPHVFDYFRQADATTTRQFGGLGLGLAIVRHLVELHGGTVWAESAGEGQGASFTVRLPLIGASPQEEQVRQPAESMQNLQGVKVLVVDDDADTREYVVSLLELHGASVTVVTSANEALAAVTQAQPDLLLSDIGMPEMDGYMLLQQLRSLLPEQGGRIPAIALTAYASENDAQQAISAGFQQHIAKPVEPATLIGAITDLLNR